MKPNPITEIIKRRYNGEKVGIYSACSANEFVIEAVLERAAQTYTYALIEATANQVNQFGGYTGMKPKDFADFVYSIAKRINFPIEQLILGGDHLGPLTWQNESEASAMEKSKTLIRDFVLAGFSKIHIDTSMRVADDDKNVRLSDETIAARASILCKVAEEAFEELSKTVDDAVEPVYIIGSEVPIPGGAVENDETVSVTKPEQFEQTYETFRARFEQDGLKEAFKRVVGVVVQPGVEFSDLTVTEYNRENASALCGVLKKYPGIVFEGHSTDYQTPKALKQMVEDGVAILKVGPALTYGLREALFALCDIERDVFEGKEGVILSDFKNTLESVMLANPVYWGKYYHGGENEIAIKRKYSFSDRCRYYLPDKNVVESIKRLIENINSVDIPISVIEQYMPGQYKLIRENKLAKTAEALIKGRITDYINDYIYAVI